MNKVERPDGVFPQAADVQRDGLLIVGGHAGVDAGSEHFGWFPYLAKNLRRFCLLRCPFGGHFATLLLQGQRLSFSASQDAASPRPHPRERRSAPASRGSSRASSPRAFAESWLAEKDS